MKTIYTMIPWEHTLPIRSIVAIKRSRFMQCYQAYCKDIPSPPSIAYSSGSVESQHRDASTSTQHSFEVRRIEIIELLGWRAQLKAHLLPPTTIGAYHHLYTLNDLRIFHFIWVSHPTIRLLPPSKLVHHFHQTNWNLRPVPWKVLIKQFFAWWQWWENGITKMQLRYEGTDRDAQAEKMLQYLMPEDRN